MNREIFDPILEPRILLLKRNQCSPRPGLDLSPSTYSAGIQLGVRDGRLVVYHILDSSPNRGILTKGDVVAIKGIDPSNSNLVAGANELFFKMEDAFQIEVAINGQPQTIKFAPLFA